MMNDKINSNLTTREKLALRILRAMFVLVAPYQKYGHQNAELMRSLFDEKEQPHE